MSETTPETSDLREKLAEALSEHELVWDRRVYPEFECSCGKWHGAQGDDGSPTDGQGDNPYAFRTHVADALLPVVAQEIAAAEQRALEDAAHEIEHSVIPSHPNAGYRDGHAHAAWVVRSLINRAAALAEPAPQEGKDGLRARIEALCVDLERSSHGGNWIRGDERRGCVAEVRAALAERAAEEPA